MPDRLSTAPILTLRASYGREVLLGAQHYLGLDRTRLTALALVIVAPDGIKAVAELACPHAVYRRRVRLVSTGERTVSYLLGCPCHNVLVTLSPDGIAQGPFVDVELLPSERG